MYHFNTELHVLLDFFKQFLLTHSLGILFCLLLVFNDVFLVCRKWGVLCLGQCLGMFSAVCLSGI